MIVPEQETAVRNALLAARASIDAALALMAVGRPGVTAPASPAGTGPTTLGATSAVKLPTPACPHPPASRQELSGFGGKKATKFFCKACESMVEE